MGVCKALLSDGNKCGRRRYNGTVYCMYHLCGFGYYCDEYVSNAFMSMYKVCEKHTCQMPGCETEAIDMNMCQQHLKSLTTDICYYPLCSEIQDPYSNYCMYHKCRRSSLGNRNCELSILPGFTLCEKHKCKLKKCSERKIETEDYCDKHRCLICRGARTSDSLYCIEHQCKRRGCKEYKICRFHACVLCGGRTNCEHAKNICLYCKKLVPSGREYCPEHTCKLQGNESETCENGIDCKQYKYFCAYHKCVICEYTLNCYRHKSKNIIRHAEYVIDILPKDIYSIIISYL